MAKEIERKFLVRDLSVIDGLEGTPIQQGYVASGDLLVRVRQAGEQAFLTLKGKNEGLSRDEFEYPIPLSDALAMLEKYTTVGQLAKTRHRLQVGTHVWEIDVFEGELEGLTLAEVELTSETEKVDLPPWLGPEVSADHSFSNSNLATLSVLAIQALRGRVSQLLRGD